MRVASKAVFIGRLVAAGIQNRMLAPSILFVGIFAATGVSSSPNREDPLQGLSVREILAEYEQSVRDLGGLDSESTSEIHHTGDIQGQAALHEFMSLTVRRDGNQLAFDRTLRYLDEDGMDILLSRDITVIDDRAYRLVHESGKGYSRSDVLISADLKAESRRARALLGRARVLDGQAIGDDLPLATIFREAGTAQIRVRNESVGGHRTIRLETNTPTGNYVMWLDPAKRFQPRRIEIRRTENDLYAGRLVGSPPPELPPGAISNLPAVPMKEHLTIVEVTQLVQFEDGIVVPTAARIQVTRSYANGQAVTTEVLYRRTILPSIPGFDAMSMFAAAVPEGSKVFIDDAPAILYEWRDGGESPTVDAHLVAGIDRVVEAIRMRSGDDLVHALTAIGDVEATPRLYAPYCGVNCLYAAMRMYDRNIDYARLVRPEYIGTRHGSSLAELVKAATDNGLYAVPVSRLTFRDLRRASHPVIIHTKSELTSTEYDHFVLVLGEYDGSFLILDPPEGPMFLTAAELAPLWDGRGLILSQETIVLLDVLGGTWFVLGATLVLVAIATALLRYLQRRWLRWGNNSSRMVRVGLSGVQLISICVVAVITGAAFHFRSDSSFLAHPDGLAVIERIHAVKFLVHIDVQTTEAAVEGDVIIVDARPDADYQAGHVTGAISVPPDSTRVHRTTALAGVPKDARIIVYCQNSVCQYDEKVARSLLNDGFTNIEIFSGGWDEWQARKKQ
jgi:rhodanese-related sulfurtransferase